MADPPPTRHEQQQQHPHASDAAATPAAAPASTSTTAPAVAAVKAMSPERAMGKGDAAQKRKLALLEKIAEFEKRGAILYADAHTLRNQVHDSTSGQWRAVETRLKQLAMSWNPYQDFSAEDRKVQEKNEKARREHKQSSQKAQEKLHESDHQHSNAGVGNERSTAVAAAASAPPKEVKAVVKKKAAAKKQDFYELLQIDDREIITSDVIRRQFRKLALLLHPDKQQQAQKTMAAAAGAKLPDAATASAKQEGDDGEKGSAESRDSDEELPVIDNSIEFARLRLAYETLSDPVQRAAYDAKLRDTLHGTVGADDSVLVKDQIQLEASTDFASLEWMARVKHKMDVMDRIAEWAKILGINATEIRFETGEPCNGRRCGKIVTMDRDLECYGSPRRRVYVCLLHKYIHACDELCTSRYGDAELDKRVCPMRAYWLIQNWLFDQLQHATTAKREGSEEEEESKDNSFQSPPQSPMHDQCNLEASEIHLGDGITTFNIANASMCRSETCTGRFQYLDDGIYACQTHGTPHICTYEQCDAKLLRNGRYACWASGNMYGGYREEVGTGTRTRQIVYTDSHGESAAIEMEVPVLLPLGKMTSYLLEGSGAKSKSGDVSSLSPPPPGDKARHVSEKFPESSTDERSPRPMLKRRNSERETSPVRARIRRRLSEKVQQSEVSSFYIHLKLPAAVANLPRVALELQDPGESEDMEGQEHFDKLLPIRVRAKDTVNYIKFWMEELTDQQISIWDQQLLWGDTVIGDEGNVMVLEEHGIVDGCVLELRLHDDCPLLVSTWNGRTAISGNQDSTTAEYNTVMISKEAEEELEDLHDEWENVIAVEEEAFKRSRLIRKREKLEDTGALNHTELIQYDGKTPRLVGVVPTSRNQATGLLTQHVTHPGAFVPEVRAPSASTRQAQALQAIAEEAKPLKK